MSLIPGEVGRIRFRKRITDDAGDWQAIVGLKDRLGAPLAGFERYLFMAVPSREGTIDRVHVNTDGLVDFEILDFPGVVDAQDGPHSVVFIDETPAPGEHFTQGGAGALPSSYSLGMSNSMNWSANILTIRLNAVARRNVTVTVIGNAKT